MPYIFVWWLLRKGHTTLSRVLGFGWLALVLLFILIPTGTPNAPGTPQAAITAPEVTEAEKAENAAAEQRRADEQKARELRRSPENFLTLENVNGVKGGFETILMLSGSIQNSSDVVIKDVEITCDLFGPSGTKVGNVRQTLFEQIPANGSKRFNELSMGFMGSDQVANFNCSIAGAEAIIP